MFITSVYIDEEFRLRHGIYEHDLEVKGGAVLELVVRVGECISLAVELLFSSEVSLSNSRVLLSLA